jgi:hypothetical protein
MCGGGDNAPKNSWLPRKKGGCMILFGESLNVISTKIGRAFKERDPKPIQEEALFQKEKGMDYIDINLGPAKKGWTRTDALGR